MARKRLLSRLLPKKVRTTTPRKSKPKRKPAPRRSLINVTRQEYNEIVAILDRRGEIIDGLRRELETQFKRMAQIQSELDEVRNAWLKSRN